MSDRIVFGATGLEVSPICFGTWQLSPRFWGEQSKADVLAAMSTALEAGINFFGNRSQAFCNRPQAKSLLFVQKLGIKLMSPSFSE